MTDLPYPETLPEFQRMFPDEDECEAYLLLLRFPGGFECPRCGYDKAYMHETRRVIECARPGCKHQVSLTAGTIMHKTHMPLRTWFYGAFLVTVLTPGMSGVQFQKVLGIKSYETAFTMLHKIRAAMVDPLRTRLEGVVEMDESYVGGVQHGGKGGRSTEGRTPVVGAVEVREKANGRHYAGRLRLRTVPNVGRAELEEFAFASITPGAEVRTDGWKYYNGLAGLGYRHIALTEGKAENAAKILPLIHREISNLKTWLQGTHHGRVEPQHLQAYANEFVFRHNRRFWPFSAFQTVLRLGMGERSPTYDELYAAEGSGARCIVTTPARTNP